ncbi:hypothetical protein JYU34_008825 [Plutella xylostella]|uniref:Protein argonaute-2 n=1 Tax=Plutella xylostella TaxID=51655 RepID=A0ABQ7QM05_PLUXY|nr:hypothetical protein JYU34_008825 [Plutella xylostella]
MGRGKKKGGKKSEGDDVEAATQGLSSLELSAAGPSQAPSQSVAAPPAPAPALAPAAAPAPVPASAPTPAVEKAATDEMTGGDDTEGGLGLGGPKRKRPPRKKKGPAQASGDGPPGPAGGPAPGGPGPGGPAPGGPAPVAQAAAARPAMPGPAGFAAQSPTGPPPQPWGGAPVRAQSPPSAGPWRSQPPPQQQARPPPAAYAPPRQAPHPQPTSSLPPNASRKSIEKSRYSIPAKILGNRVPCRKVQLITNYLAMKIKPMKIHRYDVIFTPDKPKKFLPRAFQAAMQKFFPKIVVAFDQTKNFYSVDPLPKVMQTERYTCKVELQDDYGKTLNFEMSFKGTGIVDFQTLNTYMNEGGTTLNPPTEAIQCVDVVLRQGTLQSYIKAGRQFFKRPNNPILLGDGLEMWTGLFQSAIFTSRPFINIDVAHKGFPIQQSMLSAIQSFRLDPTKNLTTQRGRNLENFLVYLKGLKVVASLAGDTGRNAVKRDFIVNGIVDPANQQKFLYTDDNKKQSTITVEQYFRLKGCRLQYPNLNCVWVGPRDRSVYYPMEILDVAYGQVRLRQLNETQLQTMVREAATPPHIRKEKIHEVIRAMKYSTNPYFEKFGLQISDQFTSVEGKVLFAPKLEYGCNKTVNPIRGAWNYERLLAGAQLEAWGLIAVEVDAYNANAEALEREIKNQGEQMGMLVRPALMRQFNVPARDLEKVMSTALEKRLQLLVVVVSSRTRDVYSQVKKIAEKRVGLLTQCIKDNTAVRKLNPQTVRNILLKVNSKLSGINQALHATSLPACMARGNTMVVGADVTHPSPDQSTLPSIAAVTASIDKRCFKYNIEFSIQTPKKEIIVEFEDIMVDHLQMYRKAQGALPAKIYVFRDGVSEGQFAQVMNTELQAVYAAYARLSGGTGRPEVLFMLVQKRHHTRLFPAGDSKFNVEPGTVVDSLIVHPRELDFYLVSHHAIKGTARPTRYHAVCNDGGVPHDEIEQLTYYLCHLYSRCSRSVSYPTPTYYAHLACIRARQLTFNERFDNAELEKKPVRFRVLPQVQQRNPMFFV